MKQSKDQSHSSGLSPESNNGQNKVSRAGQYYEIRIKGQLSNVWAEWFEGMTIKYLDEEEMLLSGSIVDQSALMGILNKLVHLNLTLISVKEIKKHKEKK